MTTVGVDCPAYHVGEIGRRIPVEYFTIAPSGAKEPIDLSAATTKELRVRKPSGAFATWALEFDAVLGTGDGTDGKLVHVTIAGDLDEVGVYAWQPWVVTPQISLAGCAESHEVGSVIAGA